MISLAIIFPWGWPI
ncbi:Pheromone in Rtg/SHP-like quorum-sensing system RtgR/RtgS [Streptococcus pneumoniae]|nr:hypothetical protein SPV_2467 [Streptococcus pneumoniae]